MFLDLNYAINELEHDIRDLPHANGYQESAWLTFPLPIGGTAGADVPVQTSVSQVQVPVPLRSYPDAPRLTGQLGVPSVPGATGIADAKLWNFAFDFERRAAAQDATHVSVAFGQHDGPLPGPPARIEDVLPPLATFAEAWPALKGDLAILPTLPPGAQNSTAAIASHVLSCLAAWVARVLEGRSVTGAALGADPALRYRIDTTMSAQGTLDEFLLTAATGPTGLTWPDVYVLDPKSGSGTPPPNAGFTGLSFKGASGLTALYLYPPGRIQGDATVTHRMWFDRRDVIGDSHGDGGVSLARNERLIAAGPLGPTGSGAPWATNSAFVYTTPEVHFIDPLVPTLETDSPINVASLDGGKQSLEKHLTTLLSQVLELGAGWSGWVQLLCSFAYPVDAGRSIDVVVPIRLVPVSQAALTATKLPAFVATVATSLENWRSAHASVHPDGQYVFELSVFTPGGAPSGPTGLPGPVHALGATGPPPLKPILQLTNLYLQLSDIS